jgi:glutaredoxin
MIIIKFIRLFLGCIIAALNWLTQGSKLKRTIESQQRVEQALQNLSLYQFNLCPFCIKTRRAMHKLNLPITLLDAKNDEVARQTLLEQGGRIKVPCLRIEEGNEVQWMYQSDAIINYLQNRFSKNELPQA